MRLPGDDDLNFVRRQLDDLSLSRAMGTMTDSDRTRHEELCDQEQVLLGRPLTLRRGTARRWDGHRFPTSLLYIHH